MITFKNMFPYLLICAIAFYALPLLGRDTGSFMIILLILMPLTCFIISIIYGLKNRLNLLLPLGVGLLFMPTIFIYYNSSAWVYTSVYMLISLMGNIIGKACKNN